MLTNEVREIGRIVKDVELKTTASGSNYARFTLAIDQGKDNVEFIDMVSFGKTAELIAKYGNKGNLVAVGGMLKNSTFEKDGKNYRRLDVVVNEFRVLHYAAKKDAENTVSTSTESSEDFVDVTPEDIWG